MATNGDAGHDGKKCISARGVMTPRRGHVRELQNGMPSIDNYGSKGSGFMSSWQERPPPSMPPMRTSFEDPPDEQVNALKTASNPAPPGALFSGHNFGKSFHFDPIATVVQVDFPSRISGAANPPEPVSSFGKNRAGPAVCGRGSESRQGLGICGAAFKACLKSTGLTKLDLEKECVFQGSGQDERLPSPIADIPTRNQSSRVSSMFFCCPEDQVVLRGAQGSRTSIPTRG